MAAKCGPPHAFRTLQGTGRIDGAKGTHHPAE